MEKCQHCKLQGSRVTFLGSAGAFENKRDLHLTDRLAFSKLEDEGWELVTVLNDPDPDGDFIYFFKRLVPPGL